MKTKIAIVTFLQVITICLTNSVIAQSVQIETPFPERFDSPLGFEYSHIGSNDAYVVGKMGIVYKIDVSNPEATSEIWIDISDRILIEGGEMGLLGMTFHPNYPETEVFFLYYTFGDEEGNYYSTLSRFSAPDGVPDTDSEERVLIIEQPDDNHNGGQIAFGPDGYLYLALGDGGRGVRSNGQNTLTLNGSILRIDVSEETGYSVPNDNPFVGNDEGLDEIYAWGFRNPWRMSFDPVTGNLWVGDVGQFDWESIYIIDNGKNYGWPIIEGSECFPNGTECDKTGLEMPLYQYPWDEEDTGRSITGGYVYRGSNNPSLYGKYIYGDFISRRIWALEVNHDTREVISNTEIAVSFSNIPSFGIDSYGEIYILGWGSQGRIYTFQKEEPLEPPGVVVLVSPENGAVDVSVNPVLSWDEEAQGTGYSVQVSGDSEFSTLVVDELGITNTQFEISGLSYETTYYWRVRASNEAGDGAWSGAWSFTTEQEPVSPPGVVVLLSPADGAVDVSVNPVLSWDEEAQGTGYSVQVSGDSEFSTLVVDELGITNTQFEISGLSYETTYYWRVRASNEAGDGAWSGAWSFTTEQEPVSPPGVVVLLSPADGAVDVSVDPVLSWDEEAQGTGYSVQVSGDSEFSTLVVDELGITNTQFEISGLSYETTYYWRVRASNEAGDGAWSGAWSFTTEEEPVSPPGVVVLASPEDGAVEVSVDPVLDWQTSEGATGYRLQVASDSEFTTPVADETGLTSTQFSLSRIDYQTTYYWRVRANNEAGDGVWSAVWDFTTITEPGEEISETSIDPNFPNPFNPTTNIRYRLVQETDVLIDVYDLNGRHMTTLVNSRQQRGVYTIQFDASGLTSGIHFLRLKTDDFIGVEKLTLIK